jgi:hypothetical protein
VEFFQQQPGLAFAKPVAVVAGGLQPDQYPLAEPPYQLVFDRGVDAVGVGGSGGVRLVDQPAQRVADLDRPVLVGVQLDRSFKIVRRERR